MHKLVEKCKYLKKALKVCKCYVCLCAVFSFKLCRMLIKQ